MIKNHWYAILPSRIVKKKSLTGIKRLNEKLVLWRDKENQIYCIKDQCIHRGASLSAGQIVNNHVQCPFHGIEYDGTGKIVLIPANGKNAMVKDQFKVLSYPVKESHGLVWIFWWNQPMDQIPDLPVFDNLDGSFSVKMMADHWNVHYTRAIENQLDVVHVPFVHHNTIGRGNRTVIHGPLVKMENDGFKIYVKNEKDYGQVPLKPEEFPEPKPGQQHLHFRFPHVWQNYITEKLRIFVVFTPIDDENTLIYMSVYQKILKFPLLKQFFNGLNMWFSKIVLHQDKRVVLTQIPKKSALKMGEKLFYQDRPIVEYRRMRDALLKKNNI